MEARPTTVVVPDGPRLDGELAVPAGATRGAVLTHPHPLMGGSMSNPVPEALFGALTAAGVAALRFDFRGTGASGGVHGGGVPEADDVRAAVGHLGEAIGAAGGPGLWIVGYSFGADVATQVVEPDVAGWVLVAPPLRSVPAEAMTAASDARPTLVVVGAHDQFLPPAEARAATASWRSTEVVELAGADHFFTGRTGELGRLVVDRLLRDGR